MRSVLFSLFILLQLCPNVLSVEQSEEQARERKTSSERIMANLGSTLQRVGESFVKTGYEHPFLTALAIWWARYAETTIKEDFIFPVIVGGLLLNSFCGSLINHDKNEKKNN